MSKEEKVSKKFRYKANAQNEEEKKDPEKSVSYIAPKKEEDPPKEKKTKKKEKNEEKTPEISTAFEPIVKDFLEFKNGENILKIIVSEISQRRYKLDVILNDDVEINPSTYSGSASCLSYWKLLKKTMK